MLHYQVFETYGEMDRGYPRYLAQIIDRAGGPAANGRYPCLVRLTNLNTGKCSVYGPFEVQGVAREFEPTRVRLGVARSTMTWGPPVMEPREVFESWFRQAT
jgi:hypothetical protein